MRGLGQACWPPTKDSRSMTERILVEGVGSVGGLLAGELLHHGHALTLVTGNAAITDAIRARGLAIETPERRYTVAAEAYTALDELPRAARFDSAWLLMMAGAVEDAARATLPWLTRDGSLVSFQNGMVGERIAALCGAERVVNVSVVFGAVMTAPGCYTRNTRGALFIGQPGVHEPTPRLAALKGPCSMSRRQPPSAPTSKACYGPSSRGTARCRACARWPTPCSVNWW